MPEITPSYPLICPECGLSTTAVVPNTSNPRLWECSNCHATGEVIDPTRPSPPEPPPPPPPIFE